MALKNKVWIALLTVAVISIIGARFLPYFPGDIPVTRFVQWAAPESTGWAQGITSTAKSPWSLLLIAVTAGLSWWLAGWRGALLALAGFAGVWVLGKVIGPVVGRPRPSPDLVYVADRLSGYSFPSTFALTYSATIGFLAVLFQRKARGALRISGMTLCILLLFAGWAARIALGAHWPSDVILSYLVGMLWACFLIRYT